MHFSPSAISAQTWRAARGGYIHPNRKRFLCAAHTEADLKKTRDVAEECFELTRLKLAVQSDKARVGAPAPQTAPQT